MRDKGRERARGVSVILVIAIVTISSTVARAQRESEWGGDSASSVQPTATAEPAKITCAVDTYFQIFSYFLKSHEVPKFTHTATNEINLPGDATELNIKITLYSVDDYSPKLKINGVSTIDVSEGWKRSYSYSYPFPYIDVSSSLHSGKNVLEATATDIQGVVNQHIGLGVRFVGSYKASACTSEIG